MNKKLNAAIAAGILALSATSALQAADRHAQASTDHAPSESAAERFIDDAAITASIKARHAQDDLVRAFVIEVETVGGEVQLSGFTASPEEKERAEKLALGVDGVRAVRNDIVVRAAAD
ncbi:MAG: BON domain-containing protein [Thauera phenolivorans]|mgnify:CR=1 FL=1|uniref:BON domain-containing protein n=1 Tax=Thauera phenolivorans TaxID=1792543 RepID=A0A7X7R7U3_9RHOO|nr:BON domain-containing protein [Thauera phenolivorans]